MSTVLTTEQLHQAVAKFTSGRVLVVGDFAIDEMIYGTTERLSREAPVVILNHQKTDILLGAGANAAHNVAALSAQVAGVGLVGDDEYAPKLKQACDAAGINHQGLLTDADRPTTTKTRLSGIANHSVTQQIVRIDRESRHPVAGDKEAALITAIQQQVEAHQAQAVLLSDYALGAVTEKVIAACQQITDERQVVWAADSHHPLVRFKGATIVTPNQPEAEQNLGYPLDTWAARLKGGQALLETTGVKHLLLTLGGDGMMLFHREGDDGELLVTPIPVFNRSEVFDVTGAGDTVIGTSTLAIATGADLVTAAVLGNLAASLVVRKFGTAVTNTDELTEAINRLRPDRLAAIQTKPIAQWHASGPPRFYDN
jgi:rfaE bifunctional protein kinase chain/domain